MDAVAFGSDFDGATMPAELGGIEGLPRLVDALRAHGFDDEALAKITHGNWLRVLGETWRRWGRYFELAGVDPRETLVDARRPVRASGARGRPRRRHRPRHGRAPAPRVERDRDRRRARGDRPPARARRPAVARLETRIARFHERSGPLRPRQRELLAPVHPGGQFDALWARIVASIRPGGRFAGQLFGVNDEWAGSGVELAQVLDLERRQHRLDLGAGLDDDAAARPLVVDAEDLAAEAAARAERGDDPRPQPVELLGPGERQRVARVDEVALRPGLVLEAADARLEPRRLAAHQS